ncbi:metalloprotease PmbA [Uliginosibacterium sp. H1]|uniref:metalloprotease PmbA n=1 Tax=Uliginosibacterium sp. H1 TaxID=3114757 RepID=UPI002E170847|nr:metalloprotease PmbA [Uliginosibacterium sp. H1]
MTAPKNGFNFSQDALADIARELTDYARSQGATASEADVSEGFGHSVSVRRGEVETIEYNRDKGIGVTVYIGQQRGHASSSDFSREALHATVDAALSIARFTAADPAAGLADEALLWRGKQMDLSLHHPWGLSVDQAVTLARECESAAFDTSPQIRNSEGANVSTHESHFVSANSLGFCSGFSTSRHSISCSVIAGEDDAMQRDDWYAMRRNAAELPAAAEVGRYAAQRTLARVGARKVKTCKVPVIFEAPLACGLIGGFVHAASGGSLYRKSSFLLGALDQQIFSKGVRISEEPHLPGAMGSTPFDDEGVATRARDVVSDGVLRGYFLGSYSARKLGMQTTANAGGAHNLILHSGKDSLDSLIGGIKRGLLVTELLGQGINYVTGDYSRGAAGYWIENGRIAYPVAEITIAGNLREMFRDIQAVGSDVIVRGARQTGSVLIGKMTVAGD